jgi:hypothetical protein
MLPSSPSSKGAHAGLIDSGAGVAAYHYEMYVRQRGAVTAAAAASGQSKAEKKRKQSYPVQFYILHHKYQPGFPF